MKRTARKISPKGEKVLRILGISLLILIILRIALPFIVLHVANKKLAALNGYYGHIQDVDLALIRGAYSVDSMYLNKIDSVTQKQTRFFSASKIDLSIEWKALFHGSLVGEVVMDGPELLFTKDKVEPDQLQKDSAYFRELKDDAMPLRINRFEVRSGIIRYKDEGSSPPVDIQLNNAFLLAENLRNSYDSTTLLPANIEASASMYDGTLTVRMRVNPLAIHPTFDVNTELKNTDLKKLNDFFQAYSKIDVNKGTFGLYAEVAAKEGRFTGYVKPLIKDLDILGKEDRDDNILRQLWEGIVGAAGQVFKNQEKDQVATKIPMDGSLKNPNSDVWYAVGNILRNAFIQALEPAIDNEINIASVDMQKKEKTFLQKIFGKKPEKKE